MEAALRPTTRPRRCYTAVVKLVGLGLLSCFLAVSAVADAAPSRVGVVVVSGKADAAAAGEIQATLLESIDAEPLLQGVGCEELELEGVVQAEPPVLPDGQAAIERIAEAETAYYEVEYEVTLRKLDEASSLIARAPATVRARYYLWRTAALIALGRTEEAEVEARNAADANPNVQVDMTTYPPQVQALVERAKSSQELLSIEMQVAADSGAGFWLDGVQVRPSFRASPGEHRLTVIAPGCWPVDGAREMRAAGKMRPPLVPSLDEEALAQLSSLVELDAEGAPKLAELTRPWGVDVVVLVEAQGSDVTATVFEPTYATWITAAHPSASVTGRWVMEQALRARDRTGPFRPPPSIRLGAETLTLSWDVLAGLSVLDQKIAYTASSPELRMQTFGPTISARGFLRRPLTSFSEVGADAELTLASWPVSGLTVRNDANPGEQFDLSGGTTATLRAGAGYDVFLGHRHFAVRPRVLAALEMYAAPSRVPDEVAVYSSHRRIAAGVGATVEGVVANHVKAELLAGYYPLSDVVETGVRLGNHVDTATETRFGLGVSYRIERLLVGAQLSRSQLDVTYAGAGNSALLPAPLDAQRTDVTWKAVATVRWIR